VLELILGGARSGKSRFAEERALASGKALVYLATAETRDREMSERVKLHQQRRSDDWALIEEPLRLAETLQQHSQTDNCILVDCLTLWLTNCLLQSEDVKQDGVWQSERTKLLDTLQTLPGDVIFVSNEVGQGVVPMGELSRKFVDEAGWLHQELAKVCNSVVFVVAGLPQFLKSPSHT
jgi:adenosylcobinamide kinase/adenosylcobinamide-phosphate guanylyltransferase